MTEVKVDGRALNASAGKDAAPTASVVQTVQVAHINAVAAAQTAARVAVNKQSKPNVLKKQHGLQWNRLLNRRHSSKQALTPAVEVLRGYDRAGLGAPRCAA
jgi:hypothetical protein